MSPVFNKTSMSGGEPPMKRRSLVVTLPDRAYRELQSWADRDERAVDQQASFLLRRLLAQQAVDSEQGTLGE
jgi:hypothetical protein